MNIEEYLLNYYVNDNIVAINCSWNCEQTANTETAFHNLRDNLRGGKGSSIVCCSGNEGNTNIWYPASSQYTLSIGATYLFTIHPHSYQIRATFSNFGEGLDIVAPGWHMFTTDITTAVCSESTNYTPDLGPEGTSFAAPMVCGAIALMASINPDLTREQYEEILLTNANKFNTYNYNEQRQYGTWNNEVGYGALDAYACVRNIPSQNLCINGPITISNNQPPYVATNSIIATCNSSTFIITNSGSVSFQAGNSISLLPGFHSLEGSNFTAFLQPNTILSYSSKLKNENYQNKFVMNSNSLIDSKLSSTIFSLAQNYPNPFNPTTTINYTIQGNVNVKITVYDILGRSIKTLVNTYQEVGPQSVIWDGSNNTGNLVASGIYIYKIEAGSFVESKKMLFLK